MITQTQTMQYGLFEYILKKPFSFLNDMLIFVFIFSFFNDGFFVDNFGNNSLKALFVLFAIVNVFKMFNNLKKMTLNHDKYFFLFITTLFVIFLLQIILGQQTDLMISSFKFMSTAMIIVFFSHYPLKKILYFIWASMMLSVVICYFNDSVSPWTFRTTGGTGDTNEFAAQLLAFMFASVYLFKKNQSKIFIIATILFFIFGLFNAGSKSAFLILAVMLLFVSMKFLIYNYKSIFNYKFVFIFFLLLLAATQINFTKIEAVQNMLGRATENTSAHTRFESWIAGGHMIEAHPLIGVGMGEFANNANKYAEAYVSHPAPHNLYIQLLAETGFISTITYLMLIFVLLTHRFGSMIKNDEVWIFFAFVSLLFMGMTLGIGFDKYFLLFIAIMMNIHNIGYKYKETTIKREYNK